MPIKWLIHPNTGIPLSFEDAPSILEREGVMPSYAVQAVIDANTGDGPSFNVRPSDIQLDFTCRRQRVWGTTHDSGINPLAAEGMLEGSALHAQLGAHEINTPTLPPDSGMKIPPHFIQYEPGVYRIEICGVPMRGRIDWLFDDRIEDLKTTTPFWIGKYPAKGSANRWPIATIWSSEAGDAKDVEKWKIQLSVYRVLLLKSGQKAPSMGRVWRRYSGVKAEMGRWKRYDFQLYDEDALEGVVGEWVRGLYTALQQAEAGNIDAWKDTPADGQKMIGSKGDMWQCNRCPLKNECFMHDKLEVF